MVITSDKESFDGLFRFLVLDKSRNWNFGIKSKQKSSIEQKISVILVLEIMSRWFSYVIDFQHFNILNCLLFSMKFMAFFTSNSR